MMISKLCKMRKLPVSYPREKGKLPRELLTTAEVARIAGVTARTVKNWISTGSLPVVRLGRSVRVDPRDLQLFFNERRGYKEK